MGNSKIGLKAELSFDTSDLWRWASDWQNFEKLNKLEESRQGAWGKEYCTEKLPLLRELQARYVSESTSMPKRSITASLYEANEQEFSKRLETMVEQKATVVEGYLDENSEAIVNFANKRLGGSPFGS